MRRIILVFVAMALASLASVGALLVLAGSSAQGAVVLPSGFTQSPLVGGLTGPTDLEFTPDGRLFLAEEAGKVRIAKPDGTLATFLDISSKATATTPVHNRVVRVTANGDKAVAGSEVLIFRMNNQGAINHLGGALDFAKDGKLYISTGDNTTPENAQKLTNLFGKVLRINKDGTIPTSNPFYSTASGKNRAIWTLGLRNPFKFAVKPATNTIFINDVGESAWEEINRGASGANYGWNFCEGNHDNPNKPGSVNCSASPYTAPVHEYSHGSTDTTGCSITGGTFYDPTAAQFPSSYVGDYFFADFCNGWIRKYDPAANTATGFATGLSGLVDLEVSKDGELYYLSRGSPGSVAKISYTGK